ASSSPSHTSLAWFSARSPQNGHVHANATPGGLQRPGQALSSVPSQVSNGDSMLLLPQSGSSLDATSVMKSSTLVSRSLVSPVVRHAAPYLASSFAKQASNLVRYFATQ